MSKRAYLSGVCGCFLIAFPQTALAQKKSSPPAEAPSPVTPEIRAALERMAGAMKADQSMEMKADVTEEEVLDDGQKLQSSSIVTASVRRPDRLYVEVQSRRRNRQFYYDGKTITLYGPVNKYYASVAAPPTTGEMLHELADRYGIVTPLLDIFEWGLSGVKLATVTSAMDAGSDMIAGKACRQYAFRQPDVDWQIWIPREGPGLPCKMVITNTKDDSHPAMTAVFDWSENPQLTEDRFAFRPPEGARRIALSDLQEASKRKGSTK